MTSPWEFFKNFADFQVLHVSVADDAIFIYYEGDFLHLNVRICVSWYPKRIQGHDKHLQ